MPLREKIFLLTERLPLTTAASQSVLLWFRLDLRLGDNAALAAALATGLPVIPIFLWDSEHDNAIAPGAASCWWLHHSLLRLDQSLQARGSRLIVRRGPSALTLAALARETESARIFCNRVVNPTAPNDTSLAGRLRAEGISLETCTPSLLFEPGSIRNTSGGPFQVFTPFWRACLNQRASIPAPLDPPRQIPPPLSWPRSLTVADLDLEPRIDWAAGIRAAWSPGETAALSRLQSFRPSLTEYATERDRPDHEGTSRLSPHLHFGEVSPARIWHALAECPGAEPYLRQLAWREFAHHLLSEYPHTLQQPFQPQFRHFPWRRNRRLLRAWQKGRTGYPIVDAAMRELWTTGWMHNRARMIVASFLVKHLLIPWQDGAAWFLDTLVDADLANNTMGWQWVAGCGVDAAPYFRIFNPVLQGDKFDPQGDYVRRWLPELGALPAEHIHQPWNAPPLVRTAAGVHLDSNWPLPIVDHAQARAAALAALSEMKAAAR